MTIEESLDHLLYNTIGFTYDELNSLSPFEYRILENIVRTSRNSKSSFPDPKKSVTSSAITSEYEKYCVPEYKQDKPKQKSKGTR